MPNLKAGTESWKLAEVPALFAPVSALADKHGFLASCFGSVMKRGEGRDLDVLMLKRFQEPHNHPAFLAEFGGEMVQRYQRPERGNHSYEVAKDGKVYHFVFGRF